MSKPVVQTSQVGYHPAQQKVAVIELDTRDKARHPVQLIRIVSAAPVLNALNFVLGCHPGSNQASFASGVGTQSATTAYGANRADWSYIPGGVVSGTALIRPDFPELLEFPFLWQQTEYCLGGASSHYMFIALAAQAMLK